MTMYGREFTDVVGDDGNGFELRSIRDINSASLPPTRLSTAKRQALEDERVLPAASMLYGLDAGFGADDGLNHAAVPFRARPRYLRLVRTRGNARDYAAGGFHVSVTRGTAGGCRDASDNFASSGTAKGECNSPINSASIRALWAEAAAGYKAVFELGADGSVNVTVLKEKLRAANALADAAYAAEGVEPPRDPETGESDPVGAIDKGSPWAMLGAVAGFAGIGIIGLRKAQGEPIPTIAPMMTLGGFVLWLATRKPAEKKA